MPPRYLMWAIVVCWLATTSWLVYTDIRPRLWPGGAPPFNIDLADEAQSATSTRWWIYREAIRKGYCDTSVRYRSADDTFELNGVFKLWLVNRIMTGRADLVIQSMYRVTREGELRGLSAIITYGSAESNSIEAQISGDVVNGIFTAHLRILNGEMVLWKQDLHPVEVSRGGSVLNPFQPLNRLNGLRHGQHWRVPMIHPLNEAFQKHFKELTGSTVSDDLPWVEAQVLPQSQILEWRDEQVSCLVIEYQGEDTRARTWVRETDGLVIQQEVYKDRDHLLLVRD